jgi:hypothetical protein
MSGVLVLRLRGRRTRTNTNPIDTEANAAGISVRACVAKAKLGRELITSTSTMIYDEN